MNKQVYINKLWVVVGVISVGLLFGSFVRYAPQFNYEGTNALYIEITDSLYVRWLTAKAAPGMAELYTTDGNLLAEKTTQPGKIHKVAFATNLANELTLRFGSKTGNVFTQKLKPLESPAPAVFTGADSVFVLGDVHGEYNKLITLLTHAGVIDSRLNWVAGHAHVVFLGDLFDRGNDVTRVLWFIYSLEDKARKAGGNVHLVLGNHELMVMSKDLRYLGPKEAAIAATYGVSYSDMYHPTKALLGQWLVSKPGIIKINKAIFAHGGIVNFPYSSLEDFNRQTAKYLQHPAFLDLMNDKPDTLAYSRQEWEDQLRFFYGSNSPFWYRGYVRYDTLLPQLNHMLKQFQSKLHVVAHTPLKSISVRYNGKVATADLEKPATELLLLVAKGKKYAPYKINLQGEVSAVKPTH